MRIRKQHKQQFTLKSSWIQSGRGALNASRLHLSLAEAQLGNIHDEEISFQSKRDG